MEENQKHLINETNVTTEEEKKQKDSEYIEALKKYVDEANGRVKYALDRLDILFITLSSGGLALGAALYDAFKTVDTSLIGWAWIAFSLAIISNLLSQMTGYWANKLDIKCTRILIDEIKKKRF